ncbi:MAG: leucine-rich repeat domain-containing protein [Prevotella sp.]|nr:leucine-rich repeat domain-containing protein [Prevotella sp.]
MISSVTTIGSNAFNNCSGLSRVIINSNDIVSKEYTSSSNISTIFGSQVKEYILGKEITSIGSYAFYNCTGLTSVTISKGVTTIGDYAFHSCSELKSITIPESVTTIGNRVFSHCSGLTNITIPESVTSIGYYAFSDCTGLTSIAIPSGVTSIGKRTFSGCTELTSIEMPGVKSIEGYAFENCKNLTSITIPSVVTYISDNAFATCSNPDIKFYVDKNTTSVFTLWGKKLNTIMGKETYTSDYLYDVNTGEKLFFETTASSVKVVSIEPKNYTITSLSLIVNGNNGQLPYYIKGLAPNTSKGIMSLTIRYKDAEGNDQTFVASQTVKTQELILTTEQPKVVSSGNVIVSATTNVDEEEKNVGFEWRRTDWTSDFASNSGNAVIYDNTMEGYIRNMNTDKLWKYRAYYLSDDGTYYYGDWVGLDPSNTSYFEPTVHTYADISTSGKVALIRGYVLNGTDKVTVQGFKYWKTANKSNSLDIAMEAKPQAAVVSVPAYAITETVAIVGAGQQMMNATLENLDYGSTYQCVAFATTSENETFYGEVQSFTTEAAPTGIEGVKEDAGSSKPVIVVACYDINGKQLSAPQKGLNIIKMSDGTTRKVVR